MIGRIIKTLVNEYLRSRHARTGTGPSRLPPTSVGEAQGRVVNSVIRAIVNRFMKR